MIVTSQHSGFQVGDIITFAGVPTRWQRLLIWLRIRKPPQLWEVSWSSESQFEIEPVVKGEPISE